MEPAPFSHMCRTNILIVLLLSTAVCCIFRP